MATEYTAEQKMNILRQHVQENESSQAIWTKYRISPETLKKWQNDLFDNGEQALIRAEQLRTKSPKTLWHRIFGQLLEGLLTPLNLDVYTDLPVMAFPPEADIVIIRRKEAIWKGKEGKGTPLTY